MSFENNPPSPISILDKNRQENTGPQEIESGKMDRYRIEKLEMPIDFLSGNKGRLNDALKKAMETIASDTTAKALIEAIKEKEAAKRERDERAKKQRELGAVRRFAEVENSLLKLCINVPDNQIRSLMGKLGEKMREKRHDMAGRTIWEIMETSSEGVISAVNFVRKRMFELAKDPKQHFLMGLNTELDAMRKIDLIEVVFGETENIVKNMRFIQVKNKEPKPEEIGDIVAAHRNFVERNMVGLREDEENDAPETRTMINSVNSVIAVGPNPPISDLEIFNVDASNRGALIAA